MEHFIETVRKYPCLWNTTAIEYRDQELKDAAWAEVTKITDNASVKDVKLKWKKLRDSYRDALKRQSDMMAKETPAHGKRNLPWKYMGVMQFLQPHMSVRKKPAESPNYPAPTAAQDASMDASSNAPLTAHHNGDARSSSSSSSGGSSPRRRGCNRLEAIDRKLEYLCRATSSTGAPAASSASGGKRACLDGFYDRKRSPPPPAVPDPLDIFFNGMCQTTKRFPYQTQVKIKKLLFNAVMEAEEALIAEQQSYASLWARGPDSSSSSEAGDVAGGGSSGATGGRSNNVTGSSASGVAGPS